MYDYFEEIRNVSNAIDKLIERVHAGIIVIPDGELSDNETAVDYVAKRLKTVINTTVAGYKDNNWDGLVDVADEIMLPYLHHLLMEDAKE